MGPLKRVVKNLYSFLPILMRFEDVFINKVQFMKIAACTMRDRKMYLTTPVINQLISCADMENISIDGRNIIWRFSFGVENSKSMQINVFVAKSKEVT